MFNLTRTEVHLDQTLPIGRILLNLENMDHPKVLKTSHLFRPTGLPGYTGLKHNFAYLGSVSTVRIQQLGSKIQHAVRDAFWEFLGS